MGVNQSKGSVDITSTPNKGPAPEVNGKKADEKIIDEKTKVRNYENYFWFYAIILCNFRKLGKSRKIQFLGIYLDWFSFEFWCKKMRFENLWKWTKLWILSPKW